MKKVLVGIVVAAVLALGIVFVVSDQYDSAMYVPGGGGIGGDSIVNVAGPGGGGIGGDARI